MGRELPNDYPLAVTVSAGSEPGWPSVTKKTLIDAVDYGYILGVRYKLVTCIRCLWGQTLIFKIGLWSSQDILNGINLYYNKIKKWEERIDL